MAAKLALVAVTSSNAPYLYDTPNVLSLPAGAEFRFRYQTKWVEEELRKRALQSGDHLKGTKVTLVFHSQLDKTLVPLREAEVVRLEVLGPVVYLRFKARKFYKPPTSAEGSKDPLSVRRAITEEIKPLLSLAGDVDLGQPLPEGFYLRQSPLKAKGPEWQDSVDARAWWNVVALLREDLVRDAFADRGNSVSHLPFFFVMGMASEDGKPRPWKLLSQGGRYRLRVLESCLGPAKMPFARVNSSSSPDLLTLEAASNLIVGKYDVVDFDFVASKLGKGQLTIALTVDGTADKPVDAWPQAFHTVIPFAVWPSWWRASLRLAVAALGASLYALWAPGQDDQNVRNGVQFVGLLLFVIAAGSFGEKTVSAGKDTKDLAKKAGTE